MSQHQKTNCNRFPSHNPWFQPSFQVSAHSCTSGLFKEQSSSHNFLRFQLFPNAITWKSSSCACCKLFLFLPSLCTSLRLGSAPQWGVHLHWTDLRKAWFALLSLSRSPLPAPVSTLSSSPPAPLSWSVMLHPGSSRWNHIILRLPRQHMLFLIVVGDIWIIDIVWLGIVDLDFDKPERMSCLCLHHIVIFFLSVFTQMRQKTIRSAYGIFSRLKINSYGQINATLNGKESGIRTVSSSHHWRNSGRYRDQGQSPNEACDHSCWRYWAAGFYLDRKRKRVHGITVELQAIEQKNSRKERSGSCCVKRYHASDTSKSKSLAEIC